MQADDLSKFTREYLLPLAGFGEEREAPGHINALLK